jgi:hypothetical protein
MAAAATGSELTATNPPKIKVQRPEWTSQRAAALEKNKKRPA